MTRWLFHFRWLPQGLEILQQPIPMSAPGVPVIHIQFLSSPESRTTGHTAAQAKQLPAAATQSSLISVSLQQAGRLVSQLQMPAAPARPGLWILLSGQHHSHIPDHPTVRTALIPPLYLHPRQWPEHSLQHPGWYLQTHLQAR